MKERLAALRQEISKRTSRGGIREIWFGKNSEDNLKRLGITTLSIAGSSVVLWNNLEVPRVLAIIAAESPLLLEFGHQLVRGAKRSESKVEMDARTERLQRLRAQLEEEKRLGF